MEKLKKEDQVPRKSDIRKNLSNGMKKYGKPKWSWSKLEIHHERPLHFGGDNSKGYLFPLTKLLHKEVTHWWYGY